jgi:hypothetical protein
VAAFTLNSDVNETRSTLKWLYDLLGDFRNFKKILPEDKVENFVYSENECSFSIKGITPMTVKMAEKKPVEFILFTSEGLGKFNFNLKANFMGEANAQGKCSIDLSGDLNPIILNLAKESLQQLVNTMSRRLAEMDELKMA